MTKCLLVTVSHLTIVYNHQTCFQTQSFCTFVGCGNLPKRAVPAKTMHYLYYYYHHYHNTHILLYGMMVTYVSTWNALLTRLRVRCWQVADEDPRILVRGEEPVVSARRIPRAHTGHVPFPVVVRAPRHVARRRIRLGRSRHRRLAAAHLGQLNNTAATATSTTASTDAAVSVSS